MRVTFVGILVLAALVAAGCGAAQRAAPVASRSVAATAFTKRDASQAAGSGVLAVGRTGVSLRPVADGTFGLMLVLENRTHRQLMLEDVRAVVPHGSFVRQLGTHLAPYFQCMPNCPRPMVMKGPYGAEQLVALHVRPLNSAQAQLNFAFAGCAALRTASRTPITRAVVVYRDTRGATFRQTIALTSSQLDLPASGRITCHV